MYGNGISFNPSMSTGIFGLYGMFGLTILHTNRTNCIRTNHIDWYTMERRTDYSMYSILAYEIIRSFSFASLR